ncbi:WAT1-related protein At3g30340-like [Mercurialis annua]|uniref:WAT1-related protein At3g30340-like n=1 Tax=Mercurialis annua TaxID=3986 RepID=UPI00215F920C|nr:WAT1-related protein At3g30340-like [Mercurialis annua]
MGRTEQLKTVFALIFINLSLAIVNILYKKVIDGGTNHMAIVTYRQLIAAIFLAPIACYRERKSRPKITFQILFYIFLGALLGITMAQYLFLWGLELTSASFACAFLNMVPADTFILALIFGLEKVNLKSKAGRTKVLGVLICMSGAILLTLYKGLPLNHPRPHPRPQDIHINYFDLRTLDREKHNWIIGSLFLFGGCLLWSSWFPIQAKIGAIFPCQYSSTAILSSFAAIQSACVTLILDRNISVWIFKGKWEIITIVFAGVVGSGLCYVGMSWCVKQRGPVFTAAFTPFAQIFAAMLDFSFLHGQIYIGSIIGSVLVIIGLYTLLWGKCMEAEECVGKQNVAKGDEKGDVELQLEPVNINSTSLKQ